jgi:hypothetical protein
LPIAEVHVAQLDPAAQPARVNRPARWRRGGAQPEQVGDPAQPHHGLLVAVEDLGQLLDGGEHHVDVEQVGDQRARGQRPAVHLAGRQHQHDRARGGGQRLHEREVDRDVPLGLQP